MTFFGRSQRPSVDPPARRNGKRKASIYPGGDRKRSWLSLGEYGTGRPAGSYPKGDVQSEEAGAEWEWPEGTVSEAEYTEADYQQAAFPDGSRDHAKAADESDGSSRSDYIDEYTASSVDPDHPDVIVKEILEKCNYDTDEAAPVIRKKFDEPYYALKDVEIRDAIWKIMDLTQRLANAHFGFKLNNRQLSKQQFSSLRPETIKVIGCIASGEPGGTDGWPELFIDEQQRKALVCGIVGNVVVEQVFQSVFFGGSEADVAELNEIRFKHRGEDGFHRKYEYARHIHTKLSIDQSPHRFFLPTDFKRCVEEVVIRLYLHLEPILSMSAPAGHGIDNSIIYDIWDRLFDIITRAGLLSLHMRHDRQTVYYFVPTFKEDKFARKYMECYNEEQMQKTHPRNRQTPWPRGTTEDEKRWAQGDEPLIKITLMDGCTAYRRGGWQTSHDGYEQPEYEFMGIRSRILTHSWVYCRWGRPRTFVQGRPVDKKELYGAAWKGGFVEFRDVPGVGEALIRRTARAALDDLGRNGGSSTTAKKATRRVGQPRSKAHPAREDTA
ncbi:hypothetical protein K469DRAFT_690636 [Zopfia rhizophila CBS 207.26]|uniref:Uncharacterized protein n=1 Tax=Zopfia rhizophila CBS 207.26 TaxID=1314779 RepID=A0A6A6DXW6_9PEZI|nr:hypothetical protein K469DRAFT_690636 [Zopfia rhizophila CBS 207.26]